MQQPIAAYAPIHGLQLYYEIQGQGAPLVLLHGGVFASEVFAPILPHLTATHQVIAVHLQGHGHTNQIDRPFRFESLADDIAALLAYLEIPKAHLLGYSFGGGVALQTAIRHPALVDRLIVVSATMQHNGWFPEVTAGFENMPAKSPQIHANIQNSPRGRLYPLINWQILLNKLAALQFQPYDWSANVAQIKAPTLLLFADADSVRPEHIIAFYQALGGGLHDAGIDGARRSPNRLAILPGATHYNLLEHPALPVILTDFLT